MSKFEDNPNLDIPIEGEISIETKEVDKLSLEQIEAEVNRRNKAKEQDIKPKKKQHVDPLEIDPNDKPAPTEEVIDPRFAGKTGAELVKMYMNLEVLQKAQTDELGSLRTENKQFKEQDAKSKSMDLEKIKKQIFPAMKDWAAEKREKWFKLFNTQPEKALREANDEIMAPYIEREALHSNTQEETRLKEMHENSIVPYVNSEIDALISTHEDWWNIYGTKIFEHAYDVFRNQPEVYDKYAAIRSKTIKTKVVEPEIVEKDVKKQTFVEGARPAKIIKTEKNITLEQLKALDPDASMAAIEKELRRRGAVVSHPQGY